MEREQPRVVLTDKDGFKVRGEVIHVGRDVGADGSFELILCILEWLDLGKYPAVLTTSQETLQGSYEVWGATLERNEDVTVIGHFQREQKRGPAEMPLM